jgi:RHS repeat-associated protein
LGRTTTIGYAHTADGLLASEKVTNPAGHVTTTTLEPRRGQPTSMTDANGKTTTAAYDHAGRPVKVWEPGRPTSGTPTAEYAYSMTKTAPSWVSSKHLGPNGNQIASYEIYDGLLRQRQTQDAAPDGKRVITDTAYDPRGLETKTSTFYNAATGPTSAMLSFNDADVDRQVRYEYDGQERPAAEQLWSRGQLRHETVTLYGFRTVTTVPPVGGTVTTHVVDGRGNLTATQRHRTRDPNSPHEQSSYGYDPLNRLTSVNDAGGSTWTTQYDLAGRVISTTDPDAGKSTMVYDDAGQLARRTDARGVSLAWAYDVLGRPTAVHESSLTGVKRAEWRYDTLAKGLLTSSTRYHEGLAYVTAVTGYDDGYRPLGRAVTVPASTANGTLAGVHTESFTYHQDGSLATVALPAVAGLPAETITHSYTNQGHLASVVGLAPYIVGTAYRWDDSPAEMSHGGSGHRLRQSWAYDEATGRTVFAQVDAESPAGVFTSRFTAEYGYDAAGNVTAVAGKTNGARDQVECFQYDHQRRLVEAWTAATWDCPAAPKRAGVDPYHRTWTFDAIGNRLSQVDHDPAGDTTWTYQVGTGHGVRPHQVARVSGTGPKAGAGSRSFGYDAAGNMTQHTTEAGAGRALAWDPEGHLTSVTAAGESTSYVHDADGERLITREPEGTTLHLGSTEVRLSPGGTVTAVRYYDDVAVRAPGGLFWTIADRNGTPVVQTNADSLAADRRRMLPYGEARGAQPAWQGSRGYVGGTVDGTGFVQLGARGYDASLGRFTSDDPVMNLDDTAQWHGYSYADNSPLTMSDPAGLAASCVEVCGGSADKVVKQRERDRARAQQRQREAAAKAAAAARGRQAAKARAAATARARQAAATRARAAAAARARQAAAAKAAAGAKKARQAAEKAARGRAGNKKSAVPKGTRGVPGAGAGGGLVAALPGTGGWCWPWVNCPDRSRDARNDFLDGAREWVMDQRAIAEVLAVAALYLYCEYVDPVLRNTVVELAVAVVLLLTTTWSGVAVFEIVLRYMGVVCAGVRGESISPFDG